VFQEVQPEGNYYNKYEAKNPIAQRLMQGYFNALNQLFSDIKFQKLYDAGCGEGYIADHILSRYPNADIYASDISGSKIAEAKNRVPNVNFSVQSIYQTDFPDHTFDFVIASEVLEHLEFPEKALEEVLRISNKYILVSVPNEPVWRVCNFLRGKYVNRMGNTPGHIQHWSKNQFVQFLERRCSILRVLSPFPWTMILAEK
jgi:ubiquinone/menaquinone biosynthesis C-methylase UbiE